MSIKTKRCKNECPKCGEGIEIEWEEVETILEGEVQQKAYCTECGCKFKQSYIYRETEYTSEEDKERFFVPDFRDLPEKYTNEAFVNIEEGMKMYPNVMVWNIVFKNS